MKTIAAILLLTSTCYSQGLKVEKVSSWTRLGYVAPTLIGLTLQGCADARAHTATHKWKELSVFARDDFWYLTVRHGSFMIGTSFAALGKYGKNKQTRIRFVKDTAAIILIGSALFDVAYSLERSGRPAMYLSSWYNHNGHKIAISKNGMIVFNVTRIAAGIYLLVK